MFLLEFVSREGPFRGRSFVFSLSLSLNFVYHYLYNPQASRMFGKFIEKTIEDGTSMREWKQKS